jgi:aminopeptidase-like protein
MDFDTLKADSLKIGAEMYKWAIDLFPLNRSITGQGNRETLQYLKNILPNLKISNFKSGEKVFDWIIPDEWELSEAYIEDEFGNKIIDFKNNNLHIISYSESVDCWLSLDELNNYLYSLPEQPDAIPYLTSYYKRRWGFCISHNQRLELLNIRYHVVIKSKLFKGQLDYGEIIVKGKSKEEIFFSTYICHPSMANNEISGIVVTAALAKYINSLVNPNFTYRFLFIPETIGSIAYLSKFWKILKKVTKAGFVVTCVGDDNNYSFLPSRNGNTFADKVAKYALNNFVSNYKEYSFLQRGSDERQYCSPLINLPVVSIMRSKYGSFPEYHTSLDNLDFISINGLIGSYSIYIKTINIIENNCIYKPLIFCEPQLGKRGLYNISSNEDANLVINLLAFIDGELDLIDLSEVLNANYFEVVEVANLLAFKKLIINAN